MRSRDDETVIDRDEDAHNHKAEDGEVAEHHLRTAADALKRFA